MKWGWRKLRRDSVAEQHSDIKEAREMRAKADQSYRVALLRGLDVSRLAGELVDRRAIDNFGDSLHITFTPRKGGNRA